MSDDDYGYDRRRDPTGRIRASSIDERVAGPPRKEARGVTRQTEQGVLREIRDHQNPPETRVKLGRLGDGIEDYGLEVFDADGNLVLGATGLGIEVVDTDQLADGAVTTPKLPDGAVIAQKLSESSKGFASDLVFSADDDDTVSWTSGTIELADGKTFSISGGDTGDMGGPTYIYLDPAASATELQTSTSRSAAVGEEKLLVAYAQPASASDQDAFFVPAVGVLGLNEDQLSANTVSTDLLQANAVTAAEINVAQLDAISVDAGTITAGLLENEAGSRFIDLDAAGSDPFIKHEALTIRADGDAEFSGEVSSGSFTAGQAFFRGSLWASRQESPSSGSQATELGSANIRLREWTGSSWDIQASINYDPNNNWLRYSISSGQLDEHRFDVAGAASAALRIMDDATVRVPVGPLILGTDPGGSEELRVGGFIRASGDIIGESDLVLGTDPGGSGALRVDGRIRYDDGSSNSALVPGVVVSTSDPSGDYPEGTLWCKVS